MGVAFPLYGLPSCLEEVCGPRISGLAVLTKVGHLVVGCCPLVVTERMVSCSLLIGPSVHPTVQFVCPLIHPVSSY